MQHYIAEINKNKLKRATDMLRYDGAYEVSQLGEDMLRIKMINFTPGRWASFNVSAELNVYHLWVTSKENTAAISRSSGFIAGIRFMQKWLQDYPEDTYLVQS